MADAKTCEMGATSAPHSMGSWNATFPKIFYLQNVKIMAAMQKLSFSFQSDCDN